MAFNPWMTSQDLIDSVKRKIAFPISQITFTNNDILAFANEEMFISQVPSVLQFHEEYFVTYRILPLQTNLSRYPIPDRATGMKLRDLFWQDVNGNLFSMTRIEEHDKAFFQMNGGSNQAIHKFYVEGNDVVLTPSVVDSPTGSLVFVFYLRPNQLVKNDRAATIVGFNQTLTINNSLIQPLDTLTVQIGVTNLNNPGQVTNTLNIVSTIFTAVNTLGGTISAIVPYSANSTQVTTSAPHQLSTGQMVAIAGSDANPNINGTFTVQVLDATNFIIQAYIQVSGTTGTFTSPNQFLIGATDIATAANLNTAINATGIIINSQASSSQLLLLFSNIYTLLFTSNPGGFIIPQNSIGIQFNGLPSAYTDQETNIQSSLFTPNALIDFLQTKPGHRTYIYDVSIPTLGISGNSIFFPTNSLLVPTGTVNNVIIQNQSTNTNPVQYILADLKVGDYICLANEAIIPQIPPDLHNGLAERTSARILAAIGDQPGLQASMQKIAEIESRQGNLLNNRSEGNPQKVVNRNSLLRYGKMGTFRRT